MSLVVLATTHRVAPGLLTWRAWEALRSGRVLAGSQDHPQLPYLGEAGIEPEIAEEATTTGLARTLVAAARAGRTVWLAGPDGDPELLTAIGELVVAMDEPPEVEALHGSYDLPGARLLDLVTTMDRLRDGCPWDAAQTHESLAAHLIEESYEAVEVIETGQSDALCGELGDVLLQVVFHARVAEERTDGTGFTIDDVAAAIVDKLVRRHPHVFGDVSVSGADEVTANWDAIKAAERATAGGGDGGSILDGVPMGQPALALVAALQRRAVRAGVPDELLGDNDTAAGSAAGGDLAWRLFTLVTRAREAGLDPEAELRGAARDFRERVQEWERRAGSG